jgi:methyl acetate hydrolase
VNLDLIDDLLSAAVHDGAAPGAVAAVGDRDGLVFQRAYGVIDVDSGKPMPSDAIFRIASMTKAVNSIAAMQLVERGLLDLDTPVGDLIPAFDDLKVISGWDGDTPLLRPPLRRATVRNLMTHTSGLTYDALHADALRYVQVTGVPMPSSGRKACFASPFVAQPGTEWNYGMSTDWTGQIIDVVSGQPLDAYYRDHIFGPLGLPDIGFELRPEVADRRVPVHARQPDGSFTRTDFAWVADPEFHSAGHGLYATAEDFQRISQLLLCEGELPYVRLLRPDTVRTMFSDQLRGIPIRPMASTIPAFSADMDLGPGLTWGLDFLLTVVPRPGMRAEGSAGWCGTFNTFYWIDRRSGLTASLYLQTLPFFEPGALGLAAEFERAVYRARHGSRSSG